LSCVLRGHDIAAVMCAWFVYCGDYKTMHTVSTAVVLRTSDREVAGSTPAHALLRNRWVFNPCAYVTTVLVDTGVKTGKLAVGYGRGVVYTVHNTWNRDERHTRVAELSYERALL